MEEIIEAKRLFLEQAQEWANKLELLRRAGIVIKHNIQEVKNGSEEKASSKSNT